MPAGVSGFISFHIERSEIFHNGEAIISHFAIAKYFTFAFVSTKAVLARYN